MREDQLWIILDSAPARGPQFSTLGVAIVEAPTAEKALQSLGSYFHSGMLIIPFDGEAVRTVTSASPILSSGIIS